MNEEETKALKEKIVSTRKERHKVTQKEALARWSYEENVSMKLPPSSSPPPPIVRCLYTNGWNFITDQETLFPCQASGAVPAQ